MRTSERSWMWMRTRRDVDEEKAGCGWGRDRMWVRTRRDVGKNEAGCGREVKGSSGGQFLLLSFFLSLSLPP